MLLVKCVFEVLDLSNISPSYKVKFFQNRESKILCNFDNNKSEHGSFERLKIYRNFKRLKVFGGVLCFCKGPPFAFFPIFPDLILLKGGKKCI